METGVVLLYGLLSFAAAVPLIALWRRWLLHRHILDRPGTRSSHTQPTVTGGGLALTAVILAAWLLQGGLQGERAVLVAVIAALCIISWFDDIRSLPIALRLTVHAAAVVMGIWQLWPGLGEAVSELSLPIWFSAAFIAGAWLWFINLYNFMDGIDGITGVETIAIAGGAALIAATAGGLTQLSGFAVVVAGATAGFLVWNWHPAKLFLGDSGSIPLGFLLGWILLQLALHGAWLAAAILPLYYFADATITLARRAWRRQAVWHAHHEHFYQHAVQRGLTHSQVSGRIAVCNVLLIGFALASLYYPWTAAVAAVASVSMLLWHLHGNRRAGPAAS